MLLLLLLACPPIKYADSTSNGGDNGPGDTGVTNEDSGGPDDTGCDTPLTWYTDADGDHYGNPEVARTACTQPAGYTDNGEDCDDADDGVHPNAAEVCDGADQDCDGTADNDAVDAPIWYADADADTYGDSATTTAACTMPALYSAVAGDCDDADPDIYPGAPEVCDGADQDCDGTADDDATDAPVWYLDYDGDGFGSADYTAAACAVPTGYVDNAADCDNADPDVHPLATETCDEVDNDCDALTDDADDSLDPSTLLTWYRDNDNDGYGDAVATTAACAAPTGFVGYDNSPSPSGTPDCDDNNAAIWPDATEICDGLDNDCDGATDDDDASLDPSTTSLWYTDADGDGFGDATATTAACDAPLGTTMVAGDCDESDDAIYPGATERCDTIDQDCDGVADNDAIDASTWYADVDGDGFGDATNTTVACDAPDGYLAETTDPASIDCDDADPSISPATTEVCNDVDDNCDGLIDDADPALDPASATLWYTDADGDTYGDPANTLYRCDRPSGVAPDGTDCDDTWASVYPGATEIPANGIDESCNGGEICYVDSDGDGDGIGTDLVSSLDIDCADVGESATTTDCDDADDAVYTGAPDLCDGVDTDCDGLDPDGVITYTAPDGAQENINLSGTASAPQLISLGSGDSGGRLDLCAGTYYVQLDLSGGAFTLVGRSGADATVLDASGGGAVLTVTDSFVSASGLSLQGGTNSGVVVNASAAAAGTSASPSLHLVDSRISGNTGTNGGGLTVGGNSYVYLQDTDVESNTAALGGGLYVSGGTVACAASASAGFAGNTAIRGGGVWLDSGQFSSSGCYWGASSSDDNDPNDLEMSAGSFWFEGSVSFSCTPSVGCY